MQTISVDQIARAGVVGAGGAGFPTHVKLSGRADAVLLNAAECEPLLHKRTICSGKYLIIVGGSVSDVQAVIGAGLAQADEAVIDQMVLPNAHGSLFPAPGQSVVLGPGNVGALGIVETFSGTSVLAMAALAAAWANVIVFRIHVAMALGGKGCC